MEISSTGLDLIKSFEKFSENPYDDGYGNITIGYGSTYYPTGKKVQLSDIAITVSEALSILNYFIFKIEHWIQDNIQCELSQNQFDACCSFFYNVGTANFIQNNPNTWQALSRGNLDQFAEDMLKFIHANGQISDGLRNRRAAEYTLFKKAE